MKVAALSLVFLANGWLEGAVLLDDVLQHVMFAQQAGLHACALAAFERIQVRAEAGSGAETMVSAESKATVILLAMTR